MITGYVHPFHHMDPRYRACCGVVPAAYAAYAVCFFDMLTVIGILLFAIFGRTGLTNGDQTGYMSAAVASCIVMLFAVVLTLFGLISKRPGYMIFHLVVRVLYVLLFVMAALMFGVAIAVVDKDPNPYIPHVKRGDARERIRKQIRAAFALQSACYTIFVLVQVWFFNIIRAAYRFVRDKRPVITEYSAYT